MSWPVLHKCEVSSLYSKRFSSYGADTKLHLKPSRGNNSESMKARHRHDLFYITVKYHDYILNDFQVMERTRNCIWNHQGEITQNVWKRALSFLYATHPHHLFYLTVKYHDYIPKGIQVTERTWICIKNIKGEITQKVLKQGLSFLYMTHRHDLFYITVKYHQNIPNGIQVIQQTQKCLRTDGRQAHRYIPWTFWSGDKKLCLITEEIR